MHFMIVGVKYCKYHFIHQKVETLLEFIEVVVCEGYDSHPRLGAGKVLVVLNFRLEGV